MNYVLAAGVWARRARPRRDGPLPFGDDFNALASLCELAALLG
jgi:hypothetical protein